VIACSDDPTPPKTTNGEGGSSSGEAGSEDGKPPSNLPGCRAGTFGAAEPLTTLNSEGVELSLRLSDDELTGIVTAGEDNLYLVKRTEVSDSFGSPTAVGGVNLAGADTTHGMVSGDGLTLFFDSDRTGGKGGRDVWNAARSDGGAGASFDAPKVIAAINDTADDGHPYIVGSNLYFASNRGGSGAHIFLSKNLGSGAPEQVALASVEEKEDDFPVVSADQLEIFFASSRGGKGFKSIWIADRKSADVPFGAPRLVTELDSDGDDRPTWVSTDGCRLYFVSDRTAAGNFDIFVSTRQ
jgi:Tol biopolymer transport system component